LKNGTVWRGVSAKENPNSLHIILAYKKQDKKRKICQFAADALGVGDGPYSQNTPESINDLIKDWNNFMAQEMDKLVLSLSDVIQSFNEEEELA